MISIDILILLVAKRIENLLIHTRDVAPLPDALPVNDVVSRIFNDVMKSEK